MRLATAVFLCSTAAIIVHTQGALTAAASEYGTYEECILDKMKDVTSDVAAKAIIAACRKVTAPRADALCTPRLVTRDEVPLKGTAEFGGYYSTQYSASLYNPSKTLTIKRLVMTVEFILKNGTKESRNYTDDVSIKPLSTGIFSTFTEFNDRQVKLGDSSISEIYACEDP